MVPGAKAAFTIKAAWTRELMVQWASVRVSFPPSVGSFSVIVAVAPEQVNWSGPYVNVRVTLL
jgi:hypothetical protein